jgi:hypothetical protein
MITIRELLTSHCDNKEHFENLEELLVKLNKLRAAYGKPLRVTSGYRSMERHLAIYAAKGITDQSKIPMKSNHLYGFAADLVPVEDDIQHLHQWAWDNFQLMVDIGLWFENFKETPTWLHCQSMPPKSGNRFFKP